MAVEDHRPRSVVPPALLAKGAVARGLAVWLVPPEGTSPDLLARAARLVLERALQAASEAEVHWSAGAALPAVEGAAVGSLQRPSPAQPLPGGTGTADGGGLPLPPSPGRFSHVAVDLATDQVLLDGLPVPLTGVEFQVLRYLVTHLSRTVGREELQQFLDSCETPGAAFRSIDVYVGRIRRKLGNARRAVVTVRCGGYRFMPGQRATVRGSAEFSI